jgi:hypothetical protein
VRGFGARSQKSAIHSLKGTMNSAIHCKIPSLLEQHHEERGAIPSTDHRFSDRLPRKAMISVYTAFSPDQKPVSRHEARSTFKKAAAP